MNKLVFVTLTALWLTACQYGQDGNDINEAQQEPAAAAEQPFQETRRRYQPRERPDPEPRYAEIEAREQIIPDYVEGRLAEDGPGLGIMIDASSPDALHQSLELIASETSEHQYQSVRASLEMIMLYDHQSWAGEDGFRAVIDGMTGEDLIEHAQMLRSR